MEPVSTMVTVLAIAAGAMLETVVSEPTKDAYAALKRYIATKYKGPAIKSLEEHPSSTARQLVVQEVLEETGLVEDPQAAELAAAVLKSALERDQKALAAIGVDIAKVKAVNITLRDIASSGSGVRVHDVEATGNLDISGVRAGVPVGSSEKKSE